MPTRVRVKPSALMFLQYFVWGASAVTMGTWVGATLRFSGPGDRAGVRTTAVAAMASPFFVGMLVNHDVIPGFMAAMEMSHPARSVIAIRVTTAAR